MCAHPWHATYHRSFWYVRQLRRLLHTAFRLEQVDEVSAAAKAASRRLILVINRRGCAGGCNPTRNVRGARELLSRLRGALPNDSVLEFDGSESLQHQARLFNRAELVIGPHGAAFANAIFCRARTSLIEFHRLRFTEPNSPLYALLSRILHLRHWIVVDTQSTPNKRGYQLSPNTVVETAKAALDSARNIGDEFALDFPNWII